VSGALSERERHTEFAIYLGLISSATTVGEALGRASPYIDSPFTGAASPTRQFSDFVKTSHLHSSALQLVYLPFKLSIEFLQTPGMNDGTAFVTYFTVTMLVEELIESITDELGIPRVVVEGTKSARVQYDLQYRDSNDGRCCIFQLGAES
jgi:hypothetical protein